MRWLVRLCLVAIVSLATLWPASAASVIFYSEQDNSYGWCAGYSYSESESCAREQCLAYGAACRLAIECDGGWSAAAFARDPWSGFGASCQWASASAARTVALLSCIYASHTLCETSEAFDGRGNAAAETTNTRFDTAWYVQTLLIRLGYDIGEADGAIGRKSRAAITDYQTVSGLAPTGEATPELVTSLLYSTGGTTRFIADVVAQTDAVDPATIANYAYRYASTPAPRLTLGSELAALPETERLSALAVLLNAASPNCTVPAMSAAAQDTAGIDWGVVCTEGSYLIALDRGPYVTRADASTFKSVAVVGPADCVPGTLPSAEASPNGTAEAFKPSPQSINGAQPEDAPELPPPDCPPAGTQAEDEFKPSPVTINQRAPDLSP